MRLTHTDADRLAAARLRGIVVRAREGTAVAGALTDEHGDLLGPFACLPFSADVGEAVQAVGAALHHRRSLSPAWAEAAILEVAVHWRADYIWQVHSSAALREGALTAAEVQCIGAGDVPSADVGLSVTFARRLLAAEDVGDDVYEQIVTAVGQRAAVELTILVGYYATLAMLVATFRTPAGEDATYPWADGSQGQG